MGKQTRIEETVPNVDMGRAGKDIDVCICASIPSVPTRTGRMIRMSWPRRLTISYRSGLEVETTSLIYNHYVNRATPAKQQVVLDDQGGIKSL